MKKQIKRLNLNKRTISNLNAEEMNRQVGAAHTNGNCTPTKGKTCQGSCQFSCGGSRCDF
jgi:hypothetical protein